MAVLRSEAEELAKLGEGPFFFQAKFFDFYPEKQGATQIIGADHLFCAKPCPDTVGKSNKVGYLFCGP